MNGNGSDGKLLTIKGYRLSPELFSTGFARGEGPRCCTSWCCEGGVFADLYERDRILKHADVIKKYMDQSQDGNENRWFEGENHEDADFPSGRCVATREENGKCVFLNQMGRCVLQVAATAEGMGKWALKPLFCILYPIEIDHGVLRFDDMLQEDQPCCTVDEEFDVPLFRACRDELAHLLGQDGIDALETHLQTSQLTHVGKGQR